MVRVDSLRFRTAAEVAAALDAVEDDLGRNLDTLLAVTVEAEAAALAFGDEELAMPVTVSIGAASTEDLDPDRASQSTLLAEADRNLYGAKHGGRNRVVTHLDLDGVMVSGA